MKQITFNYSKAGINKNSIKRYATKLAPEIERIRSTKDYKTDYASVHLPDDRKLIRDAITTIKDYTDTHLIIVIGIGGSNLGTMAVQEAILSKYHNLLTTPHILYADTTDATSLHAIIEFASHTLTQKKRVILNVISKSGSTTETIANFEVLAYNLMIKGLTSQDIIVTTETGSHLHALAEKKGYITLPLPSKVGGRYSVFSNVGLFPLGVIGINIKKLIAGAKDMKHRCLDKDIQANPAAMSASILYHHFLSGIPIADLFLFDPNLESIGKWYRQLMGESIGKEWNKEHTKQVHAGITPTVTIGSTDLHSMAQLYWGGPHNRYTSFVTVDTTDRLTLPNWKEYDHLVSDIQKKKVSKIMAAIYQAVQKTYLEQKMPYSHITLPDKNASSIGQFLQFKMMEMIYLGFLMGVNPFDQPNVESYKIHTRRILSQVK